MGFLKSLGSFAGKVVGGVTGGAVSLVGDIVGSDFLKDVGKAACAVTAHTGEVVGSLAEGAVTCAGGILARDEEKIKKGADEMFTTTAETVVGMGKGITYTVKLGAEGVDGLVSADTEKLVKVGKQFVKIGMVGALSFGVLDVIDGVPDGVPLDFNHNGVCDLFEDASKIIVENPNVHHVNPHWRTLHDGRRIWVDGDGTSAVDSFDGWTQTNPNFRIDV